MLICPSCKGELSGGQLSCTVCGFAPARIGSFIFWAPEVADTNDGFDPDSFERLAACEPGHFWFTSRNLLINWVLERYFPEFTSLLEIGCGTGFVLSAIETRFPMARLVGNEIYARGLEVAAGRLEKAVLAQTDARRLPYREEFDVVCAFDVVEHIEEDDLVLENLYRAVRPGGGCVLTVPQHRWLWSHVDEAACHKRRYEDGELREKVEAAGFRVLRSTSFVSFLLPAMVLSRGKGRYEATSSAALHPNRVLNRLLKGVMGLERLVVRSGFDLPVGGSRLLVAVRDGSPRVPCGKRGWQP